MERANILLALGGDSGNQVPKFGVTAAEIAILRAIHGDQSVTDVEPIDEPALNDDDEPRNEKEELSRLNEVYRFARIDDGTGSSTRLVVPAVFPVASAIPAKLSDLDIPDEYFKATERAKPSAKKAAAKKTSKKDDIEDQDAEKPFE